jgi:uncharacterized protein YerC
VLARDQVGKLKAQAFLCTDQQAGAMNVLDWFAERWQIKSSLKEAQGYLRIQIQRQWSAPAIARTTPAVPVLYSLVTLL